MSFTVAIQLSDYGCEPVSQELIYERVFKGSDLSNLVSVNGQEIEINGDSCELFLSFSPRNSGLSLCILNKGKVLVRYGGILKGSTNVGVSLDDLNILDVIVSLD